MSCCKPKRSANKHNPLSRNSQDHANDNHLFNIATMSPIIPNKTDLKNGTKTSKEPIKHTIRWIHQNKIQGRRTLKLVYTKSPRIISWVRNGTKHPLLRILICQWRIIIWIFIICIPFTSWINLLLISICIMCLRSIWIRVLLVNS